VVAISAIAGVSKKFAKRSDGKTYINSGSVIRYIGKYATQDSSGIIETTDPVVFLSAPYLVLRPKLPRTGMDGQYPESLLHRLYGYDIGAEREDSQVIRKLSIGAKKDLLHVSQLWCLLVGSRQYWTLLYTGFCEQF
jgi:hypothetical protein